MADLSDVEQALVDAITAAVYPSGAAAPSALPGSTTPDIRVYRGSPNSAQLDLDLNDGILNVGVFSLPGFTRETTRYPLDWITLVPAVTTITATVLRRTVTFAGVAGVAQLVGIRTGGIPYTYSATSTDTPETVAAALTAMVPGATCTGAVITVPSGLRLVARVAGTSVVGRELRRQKQGLKVTIFSGTPAQRDAGASIIDAALASQHFLPLPDGFCSRLRYSGTFVDDVPQKEGLWKRDLRYVVEYPTTETQLAPGTLWGNLQQSGNATVPVSTN